PGRAPPPTAATTLHWRSAPFPYTTLFRSDVNPKASSSKEEMSETTSSKLGDAKTLAACLRKIEVGYLDATKVTFSDKPARQTDEDRKSTRLNSSHEWISYAVSCLKKQVID